MNVRGGPMFDREETYRIYKRPQGFVVESRIQSTLDKFEFRCCFEFDDDWLPERVTGVGRSGDAGVDVRIHAKPDRAHLDLAEADGSVSCEELDFATGHLLDLEPSVVPMWAMTRRYDHGVGGEQSFFWAGRSLTRGFSLQGGETRLSLLSRHSQGETFVFTETLAGADGETFQVKFELENDDDGWLHGFTVNAAGASIHGYRRRP
jgi:hypothetical protein